MPRILVSNACFRCCRPFWQTRRHGNCKEVLVAILQKYRKLAEKTSRQKSSTLSCTGFRDSLLITNCAKYILQTELLNENVTLQLSGARGENESISGLIFSEFDTPPTLTWQVCVCVLRCGRLRWRERKKICGRLRRRKKKRDEIRCDGNNFVSAE